MGVKVCLAGVGHVGTALANMGLDLVVNIHVIFEKVLLDETFGWNTYGTDELLL